MHVSACLIVFCDCVLTACIFNNAYGSELEYKLEMELDETQEKKQRVHVAHYKWTNAKVLLNHAVTQLQTGVKKWDACSKVAARYPHFYNILQLHEKSATQTQRYPRTKIA